MFNKTWLCRYLCPIKVVFDNRSEFKQDFTPLLKYFGIEPVLTSINNPQYNASVEQIHQVISNMLVTKDLDTKAFDYIDPWCEILAYIAWAIRASYHCTVLATPGQAVLARICYLTSRQLLTGEL